MDVARLSSICWISVLSGVVGMKANVGPYGAGTSYILSAKSSTSCFARSYSSCSKSRGTVIGNVGIGCVERAFVFFVNLKSSSHMCSVAQIREFRLNTLDFFVGDFSILP